MIRGGIPVGKLIQSKTSNSSFLIVEYRTSHAMAWGWRAQTLAKILAFFEIAISIFNFIAISFNAALIFGNPAALYQLVQSNPDDYKDFLKFLGLDQKVQIATLLLLLLLCVLGLGLGLLLLSGSKKKNKSQLKAWRVTTAILYILCLPIYVVWLIYSNDILTLVISFIVIYFLGGFSFYIVYILIYEIDIEEAEMLRQRLWTDQIEP